MTTRSPDFGGVDDVFRALADPTRRELLDALSATEGQSVTELADRFGGRMTRCGVMKHPAILEGAELVVPVQHGRTRRCDLNPVPIEQLADRWISKYAARVTSSLVTLRQVEAAAQDHGGH